MTAANLALYLADHSAVSRIQTSPEVRAAFDRVNAAVGVLCANAVTLDEACYSARSPEDLERIITIYTGVFRFLLMDPAIDRLVRTIRRQLWACGHGRSAQSTDVLIAATAVHNDATVLHYDRHFELIADAFPALRQRWIVPRGSVD
ncbi:PIN domain-containing protein [Nocardia sp. CDC153]|uniref:PIN domain-containing protein n=1 Tax=Nocardia sp. CDC153 TaxID=3112167 RepID=UPI002DBD7DD5|nr:PIN domain-containing protein [Nocardia sp. CDC153]MEC3956137.1 PIN domain-containing protein [Nocardia sp. CDC153]